MKYDIVQSRSLHGAFNKDHIKIDCCSCYYLYYLKFKLKTNLQISFHLIIIVVYLGTI